MSDEDICNEYITKIIDEAWVLVNKNSSRPSVSVEIKRWIFLADQVALVRTEKWNDIHASIWEDVAGLARESAGILAGYEQIIITWIQRCVHQNKSCVIVETRKIPTLDDADTIIDVYNECINSDDIHEARRNQMCIILETKYIEAGLKWQAENVKTYFGFIDHCHMAKAISRVCCVLCVT
jgi:hypothetical protein